MRMLFSALLLGLMVSVVHAQPAYPNKPIRIIITVAPGGGSDITTRTVG